MRRFLGVLGLSVLLASCGGAEITDVDDGNKVMRNVTDYSVCQKGTPIRAIEGSWQVRQEKGNLSIVSSLDIYRGSVRATNQCSMSGRIIEVSVAAPSLYTGTTFEVLGENESRQEINEDNFKMSCEVFLSRGRMSYSFKGRCLELKSEGDVEPVLLVPR